MHKAMVAPGSYESEEAGIRTVQGPLYYLFDLLRPFEGPHRSWCMQSRAQRTIGEDFNNHQNFGHSRSCLTCILHVPRSL